MRPNRRSGGRGKWEVQGVHIQDEKLAPLRRVFEEWIRTIRQYAARTRSALGSPDYPFWYNERASLGSIAAAAWLANGVALEEYSARKREARGRADLWILIDGERFAIEAKQAWPSIGTRAQGLPAQDSRKWLNAAKRAARELSKDEGLRVGLVCIAPSLPEGEINQLESLVRDFREEVSRVGAAMVWWFDLRQPPGDDADRRLYPGVLILLERA